MTPNTRERIEEYVEQLFQYYDDIDCAVTVEQRITAQEQAELWLKRILHQEQQKAREEERDRIEKVMRKVYEERTRQLKAIRGNAEQPFAVAGIDLQYNFMKDVLNAYQSELDQPNK